MKKLVDQYNNTCHHCINKKPINADYSAFTDKIETNLKALKFKVNDSVNIRIKITIFLVNVTLKVGREKYSLSILFWKIILGHMKLKIKTEKK